MLLGAVVQYGVCWTRVGLMYKSYKPNPLDFGVMLSLLLFMCILKLNPYISQLICYFLLVDQ